MANSSVVAYGANGVADNTTEYDGVTSTISGGTVEDYRQIPVRDSGVVSNLFTYAATNTTLVNSTITLRKNKADTTLLVTYSSGQTGIKEDTSNTVSVAATDEINFECTVANDVSGSTTFTYHLTGVQFAPDTASDCITFLGSLSFAAITTDSVTRFIAPNAPPTVTATEADAQMRVRGTFVISDLYTYVSANARTTNTTFNSRVNTSNGTQTVTYTSGQTGVKEDTTHTDTLAAGDDINFSVVTSTGGGQMDLRALSVSSISTSNQFFLTSGISGGDATNFNATEYVSISGAFSSVTDESRTEYIPRFDFTAKELAVYVSANTIATSATNVYVRDNGSNSSITVSYAAAETGIKTDTSNTATITSANDTVNYSIVTPNTSGAIRFTRMGILGETAAAASGFVPKVMMM